MLGAAWNSGAKMLGQKPELSEELISLTLKQTQFTH